MTELIVSIAILGVIVSGFFFAITAGEASRILTTGRIEVQSEVRRAVDWIAKDVRQARRVDIGSSANDPTSSHIKFNMVTGYNTSGEGSLQLSSKTMEYTYSPTTQTIVRTETTPGTPVTVKTWTFRNIIEPPFYTKIHNDDGTHSIVVIDPVVSGADSPVFQSGNLVLRVMGQGQTETGGLTPVYTLIEEVKIRN